MDEGCERCGEVVKFDRIDNRGRMDVQVDE